MKKFGNIIVNILKYTSLSIVSLLLFASCYSGFCKVVLKQSCPKFFGYSSLVIVSGSMSPTINKGDLIIIKEKDSYEVKDIVSYYDEIGIVTHRIVEKTNNGYITWGDNRETNTVDGEIDKSLVIGKEVMILRGVGTFLGFFRTVWGIISLGLILCTILIISYVLPKREKINGNKGES